MWYRNLYFFAGEEGFLPGSLCVEQGVIVKVQREESSSNTCKSDHKYDDEITDLQGAFVIPGLVDIHTHGAAGEDFSDGSPEGLVRMAEYLAQHGITGFLPTSMTLPYEQLEKAFRTAVKVCKEEKDGQEGRNGQARILGIHMEGPYLSREKCGAQNTAWLKLPDIREFRKLQEAAEGMIRIVDVAPELTGAAEFAAEVPGTCRVSAAHTAARYEQARAFYEAGARHLTHLYNGMSTIHHRDPGVIGAASERPDVMAELISDGYHSHPSAVRLAFRLFPDRICLISDALRCCGMPEGPYETGGQTAWLKDGVARLESGTIAGAASNLYQDLQNAIAFGIPKNQAIQAATINPARAIGWDDRIGSIEEGKYADFLICDEDLTMRQVVCRGHMVSHIDKN